MKIDKETFIKTVENTCPNSYYSAITGTIDELELVELIVPVDTPQKDGEFDIYQFVTMILKALKKFKELVMKSIDSLTEDLKRELEGLLFFSKCLIDSANSEAVLSEKSNEISLLTDSNGLDYNEKLYLHKLTVFNVFKNELMKKSELIFADNFRQTA